MKRIYRSIIIVLFCSIAFPLLSHATVTTTRDDKGVWFIHGSDTDTFFDVFEAMGHAVAEDRLWQMETFRRTANGRLAEIFGHDYLEQDVLVRLTGYSQAELTAGYDDLDQDAKDMIDGYVAGVNQRIDEITADPSQIPFEFYVMGTQLGLEGPLPVAPWTKEDVLAWESIMLRQFDPEAQKQGQLQNAALIDYLRYAFGTEQGFLMFNDLRWTNDTDAQTYIPKTAVEPTSAGRAGRTVQSTRGKSVSKSVSMDAGVLRKTADQLSQLWNDREEKLKKINAFVKMGSYAWVVGGSKTASGRPIIYSGPQMGFSVPAICQEGSIRAAGLNISGMSLPGLPGIVIGRTPHHAWSMQVGHAHTTDYYFESPESVFPTPRMETIKVAGEDAVVIPVYRSVHGPIVSPAPYNPGTYNAATDGPIVAWRYAQWGSELATVSAYLDLARATSMDEFGEALTHVGVSQHFCYADRDGNIAYWMSGMDPVRPGEADYRFPQGLMGTPVDWDDAVLNPLSTDRNTAQGYYGGWNNKSNATYPNSYNNFSYFFGPFHRAHVIAEYLDTHNNLTFDQVRDLALNIATTDSIRKGGNPWAFVSTAFTGAVDNNATEARSAALAIMDGFDGHFVDGGKANWLNGTDRSDAWMLSDAWIREVIRLTFKDELENPAAGEYNADSGTWKHPTLLFNVILHALNAQSAIINNYNWFDDISTTGKVEGAEDIIVTALDNVLADLGDRPWGIGLRGEIQFNHDLMNQDPINLNPRHVMPFFSRSTYAHCVEMGSSGPARIESMFPLGESGDIRIDPKTSGPVFDANFYTMTGVFDAFTYRSFPKFTSSDNNDDGICFINAIRMK